MSHPVDPICIQESNLNSSFSFQIPGFSALRFDRTHCRSGILFPDASHANGGVIIFVMQGLSFSELSTSSRLLLDLYSDYLEVNISLNNSSLLSSLNVYAAPIRFFPKNSRINFFFSLHPSLLQKYLFLLEDFNCHHLLSDSKGTSDRCVEEVFNWVVSSDLLPLNDLDIPTPLHRSSPDISFAPSSLALSCSWEVLQDLGSNHLPILLTILLFGWA